MTARVRRPEAVEPRTVLQARASVARRLVKDGVLDGYTALAFVIWPTERMLAAEAKVCANTMLFRARHEKKEAA